MVGSRPPMVMGEFGEAGSVHPAGALFDHPGECRVQPAAPTRRQPYVERLPDQGMGEPVSGPLLHDQSRQQGCLGGGHRGVRAQPRRRLDEVEVERRSAGRRHRQQRFDVAGQLGDPPAHDVPAPVRNPVRNQRRGRGARLGETPFVRQQLDQLADEERVAVGAFPQRRRDLVGNLDTVPEPDVGAYARLVQPAKTDPDKAGTGEVRQRLGQLRRPIGLGVATGQEHHDRQAGQHRAEPADQVERVPVRPVQVVEHEQERTGVTQQDGRGLGQPEGRRVDVHRRRRGRAVRSGEQGGQGG